MGLLVKCASMNKLYDTMEFVYWYLTLIVYVCPHQICALLLLFSLIDITTYTLLFSPNFLVSNLAASFGLLSRY